MCMCECCLYLPLCLYNQKNEANREEIIIKNKQNILHYTFATYRLLVNRYQCHLYREYMQIERNMHRIFIHWNQKKKKRTHNTNREIVWQRNMFNVFTVSEWESVWGINVHIYICIYKHINVEMQTNQYQAHSFTVIINAVLSTRKSLAE